jgi:WD repeat-containing protein mio
MRTLRAAITKQFHSSLTMAASIVHAFQWDKELDQFVISLSPGRDEVELSRLVQYSKDESHIERVAAKPDLESVQCFSYCPADYGVIGVGQSNGVVNIFDINRTGQIAKLRAKQTRPCNAISFNRTGLVACGFDKVRNDNCLNVWDYQHQATSAKAADQNSGLRVPLNSYLPNEVVSCVSFLPRNSNTMLCGSHKFIRELDLRSSTPSFQCATKCSHGIQINHSNDMYFASYSDDGTFAVWDRRIMRSGVAAGEPALIMNKVFADPVRKSAFSFKFSHLRSNEYAVLHDGTLLRRWQMGVVPPLATAKDKSRQHSAYSRTGLMGISSTSNGNYESPSESRQSYITKNDTLFIASVLDAHTDYDKVASFDYVTNFSNKYQASFICIRQSGQLFNMKIRESPDDIAFDPLNNVMVAEPGLITTIEPRMSSVANAAPLKSSTTVAEDLRKLSIISRGTRLSATGVDDATDEGDYYNRDIAIEGIMDHGTLLAGDICGIMRRRALAGYSTDCDKNLQVLSSEGDQNDYLKHTWKWLSLALRSEQKGTMLSGSLDLGFEGVLGIWEGYAGITDQLRYPIDEELTESQFDNAVKNIVNSLNKNIFVSPSIPKSKKDAHRQLCSRVAGWNFELSQLEAKLKKLEKEGEHEKAAGWAVFHGDVERAVQALASSRKERLRLMSTAVAGYLAYKDNMLNSPWKDQCRKLASELDNPYLRAIFAFISDGSWLDVLDEGSLPLSERLGIALRFLKDNEVGIYLNRLTERAIVHGDLEGIILTGLTPQAMDLLQSYVDKTCDVQTAALIMSYGSPRYFKDKRFKHWTNEYRKLLNCWRFFSLRAKFDVTRTTLSRTSNGIIMAKPIPKQIYLRCNHCKKVIGNPPRSSQDTNSSSAALKRRTNEAVSYIHLIQSYLFKSNKITRCQHCNNPLPRCAVCLLPMGSPISQNKSQDMTDFMSSKFQSWPTFCLSCNHGLHAGHAELWFAKYDICPVPDCSCLCNTL